MRFMQKTRGFAWSRYRYRATKSIIRRINIPVLPGIMLSAMLTNIEILVYTPSLYMYMRGFILRTKLTEFFKINPPRGCVVVLERKKKLT